MSVLPSLIAALERAGGERLVLRSGETPHVLAGGVRHDLGTTKVSVKALEALTEQILSPEARKEFAENNVAVEPLSEAISPLPLVVGMHRSGDQIRIELRRVRSTAPPAPVASAALQPSAAAPSPVEAPAPPPPPPMPPLDPVIAPTSPIGTPPASPDESDWEPIDGPAAAALDTPAQSPAASEVVAAIGTPDATSTGQPDPLAAAMPSVQADPFPAEEDTVRIPRPSWLLKEPAISRTPSEPQAAVPAAIGPIDLGDRAEEEEAPEFAAPAEPEPEAVPHVPRPMKVVPIAAARTETAVDSEVSRRSDAGALEYWIRDAARREATALYLRAGHPPVVRARQRVQPLSEDVLNGSFLDAVTAALTAGEDEWLPVAQDEWARELEEVGPVRCQAFTDDRGAGLVVHLPAQTSASSLQKDIPRQVRRICEKGEGIVVVSAPAAADVMHMVAALAEATAQRRAGYVISIEPPNGLGHNISGILVSARRISGTEQDVAAAIRRAVHEGPDTLVVAMASGLITEEVVRAAQPGCLVIVGAMAPTAVLAFEALLSRADPTSLQALRRSLAASFRCGFGYRTLRGTAGGRAVVHDVMMGTPEVRTCLESADFGALERLQRSGASGMRSLDAALAGAVHRREISLRQAAGMALDRRDLVRRVRQAARERRAARARAGDRGPGGIRAAALGVASA